MINEARADMSIVNILIGNLIEKESDAILLASTILNIFYGEAALARQQPLKATDEGETWFVEGSQPPLNSPPEFGPWYIRFHKSDCCVKSFGHHAIEDGE